MPSERHLLLAEGAVLENEHNMELSDDSRCYLVVMMYCLSGNAVWSVYCSRYHERAVYNDSQLALMNDTEEARDEAKGAQNCV